MIDRGECVGCLTVGRHEDEDGVGLFRLEHFDEVGIPCVNAVSIADLIEWRSIPIADGAEFVSIVEFADDVDVTAGAGAVVRADTNDGESQFGHWYSEFIWEVPVWSTVGVVRRQALCPRAEPFDSAQDRHRGKRWPGIVGCPVLWDS